MDEYCSGVSPGSTRSCAMSAKGLREIRTRAVKARSPNRVTSVANSAELMRSSTSLRGDDVDRSAAAASAKPCPMPRSARETAVDSTTERILNGVERRLADARSAATPAICGARIGARGVGLRAIPKGVGSPQNPTVPVKAMGAGLRAFSKGGITTGP
jgi:hypothetical protein